MKNSISILILLFFSNNIYAQVDAKDCKKEDKPVLCERLSTLQKENNKHEAKIKILEKDLLEKNAEITDLKVTIAGGQTKKDKETKVEAENEIIPKNKIEQVPNKDSLAALNNELEKYKVEIQNLRAENKKYRKENGEFSYQIDELKKEKVVLENLLAEKETKFQSKENEYKAREEKLKAELQEWKDLFSNVETELISKIIQLTAREDQKNSRVEAEKLKQKIEELRNSGSKTNFTASIQKLDDYLKFIALIDEKNKLLNNEFNLEANKELLLNMNVMVNNANMNKAQKDELTKSISKLKKYCIKHNELAAAMLNADKYKNNLAAVKNELALVKEDKEFDEYPFLKKILNDKYNNAAARSVQAVNCE